MSTQDVSAVIRNKIADFLNVGTSANPRYVRMSRGFTSLNESPNAQAESRAYIGDASTSSTILGYEAQFSFNTDLFANEEAVMKIYEVGRNQKQAGQAETDYVRVEVFMPGGEPDYHPARKFRVSIQTDDISGEGTQMMELTGNLNGIGDFVPGVFNIVTKVFVPLDEWDYEFVDGLFLKKSNSYIPESED